MRATAKTSSPRTDVPVGPRGPLAVEGVGAPIRGLFALVALVAAVGALLLAGSARAAAPTHPFDEARSLIGTFNGPCGVATDSAGDTYVAAFDGNVKTNSISVYGPGSPIGSIPIVQFTPSANVRSPCPLAVDAAGDVYAVTGREATGSSVVKYTPSSFPPTAATTYSADTSVNGTGILAPKVTSVAVDPADQDVYVAEPGTNETQTVTRTSSGGTMGGSYRLCKDEALTECTSPIAATALGTATKAALEPLYGAGNVQVFRLSATVQEVTFQGALAAQDVPQMFCDASALTPAGSTCATAITTRAASSRVSSFEPDGTLVDGTIGEGLVAGANYYGVDVYGTNGDVYVTDKAHDAAYVLNPTGTQILAEITGSGPEGEGPFTAMKDPLLAVDQSDGNVLVSDIPGHGVVDEFDAAGTLVSQIGPSFGSGLSLAEAEPSGIAVDRGPSSPNQGEVYVTSGNGAGGSVYAYRPLVLVPAPEAITEPPATGVTQTGAVLHAKVNPVGVATESCEFLWGPAAGDYSGGSAPCVLDPGSADERVAVSAEATGLTPHATVHYTVRITTAGGTAEGLDAEFVASAPPTATTEAASEVEEEAATFNGTVDPAGGTGGECFFEYGLTTSYGTRVSCTPDPGSAATATPVSARLTGLLPETAYHYRVVEETDGGTARGSDEVVATSAAPRIVEERAIDVTRTRATLTASIDPNGLPTTYHFEYLTLAQYEEGGFSNPATTRTAESGSIGEGHQAITVEAPITGLQDATPYEFRVVATNASGAVEGHGRELFTLNSAGLPDDRRFELVSPADKGPVAFVGANYSGQFQFQAAPEEGNIAYDIAGGPADTTASPETLYAAQRGYSGWSSTQISAPITSSSNDRGGISSLSSEVLALSGNLSCEVLVSSTPLTSDAPLRVVEAGGANLYVRDNSSGAYRVVTPLAPVNPGSVNHQTFLGEYEVVGMTPDCSRVFFVSPYDYPGVGGAGASRFYESDEGIIRSLGVVPTAAGEAQAPVTVGEARGKDAWRAISEDGTRAFFSATSQIGADQGKEALFARSAGASVDVSQSETSTVDQGARYQIASKDGSKVFFLANYGLTARSSAGAKTEKCSAENSESRRCDLYQYDFGAPAGARLTDLSVDMGDAEGAKVGAVLGASDDGSYAYFAARGQLVPGEGPTAAENESGGGVGGTYSIYVWHAGEIRYVGVVAAKEVLGAGGTPSPSGRVAINTSRSSVWSSRVTPDGRHLIFASTAMAGSGGVIEAYLYSAGSEHTTCVSCRSDGKPEVATARPILPIFTPANSLSLTRDMSDDGNRIVFFSANLLAAGAVEGRTNLYEWEEGQVYLVATEPPGFSGSIQYPFQVAGMSASGNDIYLQTPESLVPEDTDGRPDLYDAKVRGGFAPAAPPSACEPLKEASCQSSPAAPGSSAAAPPTSSFVGPSTPVVPTHKKAKKHKRHKKHHKKHPRHKHNKHQKHHHAKKHAKTNRRNGK